MDKKNIVDLKKKVVVYTILHKFYLKLLIIMSSIIVFLVGTFISLDIIIDMIPLLVILILIDIYLYCSYRHNYKRLYKAKFDLADQT